jgi:polysaccharide biosynthesis/export protein
VLPGQDKDVDVARASIRDLEGGAMSQNIELRDGDTIFVPRAESIYVFGQVKNPGAYALVERDTTILQALSLAGGVSENGAINRVKVIRIVSGDKREVKVKLTDVVRQGDTVVVPERYF